MAVDLVGETVRASVTVWKHLHYFELVRGKAKGQQLCWRSLSTVKKLHGTVKVSLALQLGGGGERCLRLGYDSNE